MRGFFFLRALIPSVCQLAKPLLSRSFGMGLNMGRLTSKAASNLWGDRRRCPREIDSCRSISSHPDLEGASSYHTGAITALRKPSCTASSNRAGPERVIDLSDLPSQISLVHGTRHAACSTQQKRRVSIERRIKKKKKKRKWRGKKWYERKVKKIWGKNI